MARERRDRPRRRHAVAISTDLKRFKALTMGKPMIMGRKTLQSIGRAAAGRDTIVVIARNREVPLEGVASCKVARTRR